VKLQTARHPKLKEGLNQINMSWKQYIANEFFDNVLNSAEKYIANESQQKNILQRNIIVVVCV